MSCNRGMSFDSRRSRRERECWQEQSTSMAFSYRTAVTKGFSAVCTLTMETRTQRTLLLTLGWPKNSCIGTSPHSLTLTLSHFTWSISLMLIHSDLHSLFCASMRSSDFSLIIHLLSTIKRYRFLFPSRHIYGLLLVRMSDGHFNGTSRQDVKRHDSAFLCVMPLIMNIATNFITTSQR